MAKNIFRTRARRFGVAAGSLLAAVVFWSGAGNTMRAAPAPDPLTCLPTCEIDGRSLVVAGNDPTTLGAVQINIGLNFTATSSGFNFELFDGDRDAANWDVLFNDGVTSPKPDAPELIMALYGAGDAPGLLITWGPGYFPFPTSNNGWAGVSYAFHDNVRAKIAATGGYRYRLEIRPANPAVDLGWNAFKIRSNGTVALNGAQTIAFIGAMNVPGDLDTIYPNYPALTNSPYDGTWSFKTRLPNFLSEVSVWDGDMDFGDAACTYGDTDDPDTPATPPAFAAGAANEGVAQVPGSACRTGIPADDALSAAFRRVPSIVSDGIAYRLVAPASLANPGGQTFLNPNPSGNREWEQFRIQLVADASDVPSGACPAGGYPADAGKGYAASDCRTTDLPGGVWEVQLDGMDLSNLNFWYFGFQVEPIPTYSIGRLVWYDDNENGVQDLCAGVPCAPELGVPNVAFTVSSVAQGVVTGGVTDANGEFLITTLPSLAPLPADDYTVTVDALNFIPGGPLEGWVSTTGGETVTGVEVGLPVCVDTNNPVGCGEPTYAEAIFGYVERPIVVESLGRMTGGGSVFTEDERRVTHGFELHCDASELPNNLEINWGGSEDGKKGTGSSQFHLENLVSAVCTLDETISAPPPAAGFNTYTGTGYGRLNGVPGAWIEFVLTDAGEPGTEDTMTASIWTSDAKTTLVLVVSGKLEKGNQQAHK